MFRGEVISLREGERGSWSICRNLLHCRLALRWWMEFTKVFGRKRGCRDGVEKRERDTGELERKRTYHQWKKKKKEKGEIK